MSFSEDELRYLETQPLARLATVDAEGQPDVVPVGITIDGPYIYRAGLDNAKTRKYRNVRDGNSKVSLVVDDLASTQPWAPRFVRIYGTADIVERDGEFGPQPYLRIAPAVSWSWNLEGRPLTHKTDPASMKLQGRSTRRQRRRSGEIPMRIIRTHHVAITTSRFALLRAFYVELLGLTVVGGFPDHDLVFLDAGGTTVELMHPLSATTA